MREVAITLLVLAIVVSAGTGIVAMLDSKLRWHWRLAGMLPSAVTAVTAVITVTKIVGRS
jgi:hypothetical protein